MDITGDRRVSLAEFRLSLDKLERWGISVPPEEVEQEFGSIDGNDGGMILFDEVCIFVPHELATRTQP